MVPFVRLLVGFDLVDSDFVEVVLLVPGVERPRLLRCPATLGCSWVDVSGGCDCLLLALGVGLVRRWLRACLIHSMIPLGLMRVADLTVATSRALRAALTARRWLIRIKKAKSVRVMSSVIVLIDWIELNRGEGIGPVASMC